jgi:hypothetical protein
MRAARRTGPRTSGWPPSTAATIAQTPAVDSPTPLLPSSPRTEEWNRFYELTERVFAAIKGAPEAVVCREAGALRVREEPAINAAMVGMIRGVSTVYIIDGPLAADGYQWYRIGYTGSSATGQQPGIGWAAGEYLSTYSYHRCGEVDLDTARRYPE